MTTFADCMDLLPDDLTEGQLENFLAHAETKPNFSDVVEVLSVLVREARQADPLQN